MRRPSTWSLLVLLSACKAQISGAPIDHGAIDASDVPGTDDAAPIPGDAAKLGPWGTPARVLVAATPAAEDDVTLSSNALELFFAINGLTGKDLYYTSRLSTADPWTPAVPVSFNSNTKSDETPRLSADDRTLYFASGRDSDNGTLDIYQTTRPAPGSTTWSTPTPLASVNTPTRTEKWFMPCGVDHYVLVQSSGMGDTDLVEGTLGGPAPAPIDPLNSVENETGTWLSPDCLTIYFASARTTPTRMFRAQRDTLTAAWRPPSPVTDFMIVGGNGNQEDPWLSPDGRTFAFASDAAGGINKDIYLSTR